MIELEAIYKAIIGPCFRCLKATAKVSPDLLLPGFERFRIDQVLDDKISVLFEELDLLCCAWHRVAQLRRVCLIVQGYLAVRLPALWLRKEVHLLGYLWGHVFEHRLRIAGFEMVHRANGRVGVGV